MIPVVTDTSGNTTEHVQEALRTVVPFLEDVTGLRYYPSVTYLVDDVTVVNIRRATEPDARRSDDSRGSKYGDPGLPPHEESLVERLNTLTVTFHVKAHRLYNDPRWRDADASRVFLADDLQHRNSLGEDFQHVRAIAEGAFAQKIRLHLSGHNAGHWNSNLQDRLTALGLENFPAYAYEFVRLMLGYVDRIVAVGPPPDRWSRPVDQSFRAELREVCGEVLRLVDTRPTVARPPLYLRTAAPTFGVFRYEGGIPTARPGSRPGGAPPPLAPSKTPAVLVCVNAFERTVDEIRRDGIAESDARARAAAFLTSTLVHEHMHAALATGLDGQGLGPATVGTTRWAAGSNLDEAVSAWAQRHFFRDDVDMYEECSRYIRTGDYPAWPYRGADALDKIYTDDGLPAVRRFLRLRRETPEIAQREFDAVASPSGRGR